MMARSLHAARVSFGPERYLVGLASPPPTLRWRRATDARGRVTWCGYLDGHAFAAVYTLAGDVVLEVARPHQPPYSERCSRVGVAKARARDLAAELGGAR